jgi:ATP-dependent helicase/nuclease subunit B
MIPDIRNAHPQALIITPSSSISRLLRGQLAVQRVGERSSVWESIQILSFGSWIKQLWLQAPMSADLRRPLLLNQAQELAVWQEIIDASPWSRVLMQTLSLARNASQANRILAEWHIPVTHLQKFSNDEAQALESWIKEFDRRCFKQVWLPVYRLADQLMVLPEKDVNFPAEIIVYGFDQLTNQQNAFLDHVTELGCKVQVVEPENRKANAVRVALADREQEFEYAASWAGECIKENREQRIAIALADKNRQLPGIKRALNRAFFSQRLYPSTSEEQIYETGEPVSLNTEPVIDDALRILSQSHHRVDLFEFGSICRSRFISGAEEEYFTRSRLDTILRTFGELRPSLAFIAAQIFDKDEQAYRIDCHQFYQQLQDWRKCIDELPASQRASEWATDFARLLKTIGWPGSSDMNPSLQSKLNRWDDALSQLCVLDAVTSPMRQADALAWLRRFAAELTLPQSRSVNPVHIISIEEASRLSFDRIWVCGLDDELWPTASRPNPLIPLVMQREVGLPGASNSLVASEARRAIQKTIQNSDEVVLSYARRVEDRELRFSPMINDIAEISESEFVTPGLSIAERLFASRSLEKFEDQAVPLHSDRAKGGTSILKNQAACPFRAFITHRLVSEIPEEPQPGLDAAERGTLIHAVMEIVWSRLISHSGLMSADEAEREHIVLEAAQTALDRFKRRKPETLTRRFREIELERLVTLVMKWLHFEEQRQSFTVLQPEAERMIELAGLQMKIYIDRIDRNEIGEHIILDYKTGETSVSDWFGDRPDEPQLPLYALSEMDSGNEVAALCFAQIRSSDATFNGISQEKDQMPGIPSWNQQRQTKSFDSWNSILNDWRATLEKLAGDFVAGIAPVDPKTSSTCRYCELAGVCRVNELKQRLGLADVEENEDNG